MGIGFQKCVLKEVIAAHRSIRCDTAGLCYKQRIRMNLEHIREPDKEIFVYREVFTPEIHENWLRERVATGQVHQFIILEKEDRRPVGSVYLRDIDTVGGTAEYGIFIGEDDATGRGYAVEAAELMVGYARTIQGLKKLGLRVFADNEAAMRSYLSAGYEKISSLPGVECSDGECKDMIWMEQRL